MRPLPNKAIDFDATYVQGPKTSLRHQRRALVAIARQDAYIQRVRESEKLERKYKRPRNATKPVPKTKAELLKQYAHIQTEKREMKQREKEATTKTSVNTPRKTIIIDCVKNKK